MTMRDDFAVFILTHGRPNKVYTYKTLRNQNYSGRIYLLIDDEDESAREYQEKYGDEVIVFNKTEAASLVDVGDNRPDHRVYARNVILGLLGTWA